MTMESTAVPNGFSPHTVAEAAAVSNVSPSTVRAHLRQGTLAGNKIDGQWVVYLAEPSHMTVGVTGADAPTADGAENRSRVSHMLTTVRRTTAAALARLRRTRAKHG